MLNLGLLIVNAFDITPIVDENLYVKFSDKSTLTISIIVFLSTHKWSKCRK